MARQGEGLAAIDSLLQAPSVVLLSEAEGRLHGVAELWSADRDFGRFPELAVRNPLVG